MEIRAFTEKRLGEAAAFSRRLRASDHTRSYPLFADEAAMIREYRWSLAHPGGFLAGCEDGGTLTGVLCGFAEAESRYLQTTGFYVPEHNRAAARALAGWLAERFAGYTAHVGLPAGNETVAGILTELGYRVIDDSLDLRLRAGDFRPPEDGDAAVRVDPGTLPDYLQYHRRHFDDCYWNALRLEERFQDWDVYAYRTDGRIAGGLFLRPMPPDAAEIYGLHAEAEGACLPLLAFALRNALARRPRTASVLFMADADDAPAVNAALALGFRRANHYRCYAKHL